MSRTLYLYIDAGWPHQHLDCAWSLTEPGKPAVSGRDSPKQWPLAQQQVIVLSVDQLAYHQVKLPPGVNWKDSAVVSMALEDRLFEGLDRLVVVPLRLHGDELVCCTLLRVRLEQLIKVFQELNLALVRIESAAEKLAAVTDEWRIFYAGEGDLWLHDGVLAMALDMPQGDELPVALGLYWEQQPSTRPSHITLHGVPPTLLRTLHDQLEVPVQRWAVWDWTSTLTQTSPNMLVGDWMPRRKLLTQPGFKAALIVLVACVAIELVMALAGLGRTWWSIRQVKAQQLALWQEASGRTEPTDHPALTLYQAWQDARARVGESRAQELVPTLAALSQQLPDRKLVSLDYDDGRLVVVWNGTSQDTTALELGLRERGYTAITQSSNNGLVTTAVVAKDGP